MLFVQRNIKVMNRVGIGSVNLKKKTGCTPGTAGRSENLNINVVFVVVHLFFERLTVFRSGSRVQGP